MKIPQIKSSHIKASIHSTYSTGKRVLKRAKVAAAHPAALTKENGRTFIAAAMIFSGVTISPFLGRIVTKEILRCGDKFERQVGKQTRHILGKNPRIKPLPKTPKRPKTAKNTLVATTQVGKSVKELNDSLNAVLLTPKQKRNPIKNKAKVFVAKGKKYNVNPVVIMAIAMHESARGTSDAAILKNNIGGITGKNGLRKFKTVDDCIDAMAETVANKHRDNNIHTVYQLAYSGKYCDKKAAKEWAENVMYYINRLL